MFWAVSNNYPHLNLAPPLLYNLRMGLGKQTKGYKKPSSSGLHTGSFSPLSFFPSFPFRGLTGTLIHFLRHLLSEVLP